MHIYKTDTGTKVPSVTTILQIMNSPEIAKWANYLGFRHIDYNQELNRYAVRGTKLHQCLQAIVDPSLNGKEITFSSALERDYCEQAIAKFTAVMDAYQYDTIFTEKTFVSSDLGYGGTIDWFAKFNDLNLVLDFKSSKQVRMKHLLQLGGYKNLLVEGGHTVDGGVIILCNTNVCVLYPVNREQLDVLGDVFERIKFVYDHIGDHSYLTPLSEELMEQMKKKE